MSKKVRWGIIGAGRISRLLALDMPHTSNAEISAVAARSEERAKEFAEEFNIPHYFGNYQSLYNCDDVDAVYIATPHTFHRQHMIDALAAGKPVICEKPFTVNSDECEELMGLAESSGQYVMEAMWTYFLPAIRKAKEWIDTGRIGTIKHVKADFGYPLQPFDPDLREYDKNLAGGCLLEMGVYPVSIAWYFLREDPSSAHVVNRHAPNGVEDDLSMIFNYKDHVATLGTSFRCKLQNWCYIIGDEGYIAIPNFWRASDCYLYQLDEQIDYFNDNRKGSGLEFEIEAISNDILENKQQSDIMPLQNTWHIQLHMDLVRNLF